MSVLLPSVGNLLRAAALLFVLGFVALLVYGIVYQWVRWFRRHRELRERQRIRERAVASERDWQRIDGGP